MPKIIVNTESFAKETTVTQVLNAAATAHPNNSAEVIRDQNGKVVKVLVNLPDDTPSQGIANATAKINANLGVATCVALPAVAQSDFNNLTPSTDLTGTTIALTNDAGPDVNCFLSYDPNSGSLVKVLAAPAVDSVGGTGSALAFADEDTALVSTQHRHTGALQIFAANNGFTGLKRAKVKCAFKCPDTYGGVAKDIGDVERGVYVDLQAVGMGGMVRVENRINVPGSANWRIDTDVEGSADTGIPVTSFIEVTVEALAPVGMQQPIQVSYGPVGGPPTYTFIKNTFGGAFAPPSIKILATYVNDVFAAPQAASQRAIIVDNLYVEIIEAVL